MNENKETRIDPRKALILFTEHNTEDFIFVDKAHQFTVEEILLFPEMFSYEFGPDVARALFLDNIKNAKTPEDMTKEIIKANNILNIIESKIEEKEEKLSPTDIIEMLASFISS